jgi:nucleotide-binding universal stress UspA family protein
VETGKDHHCQLIVVGQGHHSFLGRAFGADTAAEVEKHAGIPVEIVD